MTILVSSGAGHGGVKTNGKWQDCGAIGNGYQEAGVARTINNKLIALTGAKDTTDNLGTSVDDNLYRVAQNINSHADGIALSHHLNAFNGKATGVEVLYGSVANKALAAKISATIASVLGIADRGAKDGTWLSIAANTNTDNQVLLIEWCFIDNPSDMASLMANMDRAVLAVAELFGAVVSLDGWSQVNGKWQYTADGQVCKDGWRNIDGKWYAFDADGWMLTGWYAKGDKWYYLTPQGSMHTGWSLVDGKWYLLGSDGVMVEGWTNSGGKWYYLQANGVMAQGWLQDKSGAWYYLAVPNGEMVTGVKSIDGKRYEFDLNGKCLNT